MYFRKTYGHGLHFPDLLDLVPGGSDFETFEDGLDLGLRELLLLRSQDGLGLNWALKDDLILVVLVEQGLLVVDRARGDLHLDRVLLCVLLDLLKMLIVAVLCEPGDDIAFRPVDLQGVLVLIVDVVLYRHRELRLCIAN